MNHHCTLLSVGNGSASIWLYSGDLVGCSFPIQAPGKAWWCVIRSWVLALYHPQTLVCYGHFASGHWSCGHQLVMLSSFMVTQQCWLTASQNLKRVQKEKKTGMHFANNAYVVGLCQSRLCHEGHVKGRNRWCGVCDPLHKSRDCKLCLSSQGNCFFESMSDKSRGHLQTRFSQIPVCVCSMNWIASFYWVPSLPESFHIYHTLMLQLGDGEE